MGARMLCTGCAVTAHPDTLLGGSDQLEAGAWLCGVVPGWLYCAGRHWLRAKRCPSCGGRALVREARAAAAALRPLASETRVLTRGPGLAWPRGLGTPRERLREGAGPSALVALGVGLTTVGTFAALASAAAGLLWLLLATLRSQPLRAPRAWDARGQPLRIEVV